MVTGGLLPPAAFPFSSLKNANVVELGQNFCGFGPIGGVGLLLLLKCFEFHQGHFSIILDHLGEKKPHLV